MPQLILKDTVIKADPTPTLDFNFAATRTLDNRLTFTRASNAYYMDSDGYFKSVGNNEARFTYHPINAQSLGLITEEARTNSIIWSSEINASWQNFFTTYSPVSDSPFFLTSSYLLSAPGGYCRIVANGGSSILSVGTTYAVSIFMKAGTGSGAIVIGTASAKFDLTNGTAIITGSGTDITSARMEQYRNGWWRCIAIATIVSTNKTVSICPWQVGASDSGGYPESGGKNVYIIAAQAEVGSFPTSYIYTDSVQRSRNTDNLVLSGSNFTSVYNFREGTAVCNSIWNGGDYQFSIEMDGGSYRSVRNIGYWAIMNRLASANAQDQFIGNTVSTGANLNVAISWQDLFSAGVTNGGAIYSQNITTNNRSLMPTSIQIGAAFGGGRSFIISRFRFWNKRIPNERMVEYTQ